MTKGRVDMMVQLVHKDPQEPQAIKDQQEHRDQEVYNIDHVLPSRSLN